MSWRYVFVTNPCRITYTNNNIVVQTFEDSNYLNLDELNTIVIDTPEAVITSRALVELSKKHVCIMFNDEKMLPSAMVNDSFGKAFSPKRIQTQINWPQERKEKLWTKIVGQKIINQIQTVRMFGADSRPLEKHLTCLEYNDETNQEAVVASLYFSQVFSQNFTRGNNAFDINGALNYGYTVLLNRITTELSKHGILSQLGIHHHSVLNRYNLSSDLIEPWRFVIDNYVLSMEDVEMTPLNKARIVDRLNHEIKFNGKRQIVSNALNVYVENCLRYLDGDTTKFEFEVEQVEEPNHENARNV